MKATVEELNTVQRRVNITIPGEVVTKAFNKVFARLQKKAHLNGFRRGKAPLTVIKRLYGQQAARDVADVLVDDFLYPAINDHKIKLISAPVVELSTMPTLDSEYSFAAVVDLMPEVALNNRYKGLSVPCKEFGFDDSTVEREIKALARRFATTSELHPHTPAAEGHLATISHHGAVEGQEHSGLKVQSAEVALGQSEVLAVLEAELLGMKVGEEKDLAFTLPDDHGDPSLAGKAVTLHVVLEQLKLLSIPALDEALAKDMQCADLEELRQKVTVQLSEHVSKQTDRSKREELFKVMGALIDFEVPPVLVDQTIDSMVQDFSFLKEEDKKKAKRDPSVRKSLAPEAKIKVKNTLILWQIGKDEGLNVDDEEVRAELRHRFAELANAGEQEMAKAMEKGGAHTRESLLLEKSMQALLAFTTFTPTPVSV